MYVFAASSTVNPNLRNAAVAASAAASLPAALASRAAFDAAAIAAFADASSVMAGAST